MAKPEIFELSTGTVTAKISNVGATIVSLLVPDAKGNLADVVLGFDSLDTYANDNAPYFGCIVGRVANRIKEGKFALNGAKYTLPINNPPNSLHGGTNGFNKRVWEVTEYKKSESPSITFKYHSKDGEEGFPGDVIVTATYSLSLPNSLKLEMEAEAINKPTPINLAQHTYWNLAGHNAGSILNHHVQIWASQITPVDEHSIPTGELLNVANTPFDFTTEKRVGADFDKVPGGYDHNYVLDLGEAEEKTGLKRAAKVKDPLSCRVLNLWTDAPGVQFYTANYLDGVVGKEGCVYQKQGGLALETQGFPNSINEPKFPSIVVQPGQKYRHNMVFEFSTE